MESRIHETYYHEIYHLSSTTKVFILSKLRNRSNGLVRERKQRGRAHWRRGTNWEAGVASACAPSAHRLPPRRAQGGNDSAATRRGVICPHGCGRRGLRLRQTPGRRTRALPGTW